MRTGDRDGPPRAREEHPPRWITAAARIPIKASWHLAVATVLLMSVGTVATPATALAFTANPAAPDGSPVEADGPSWISAMFRSGPHTPEEGSGGGGSTRPDPSTGGFTLGAGPLTLAGDGDATLIVESGPPAPSDREREPPHVLRLLRLPDEPALLAEPSWADHRAPRPAERIPGWNGLVITSGWMASLVGYETAGSSRSPSLSSGYLSTLALPLGYTGLMLSLPLTNWLSAQVGAVSGWDLWEDNNEAPSSTGRLTASPTRDLETSLGWIVGPEQPENTSALRHVVDLVASYKGTDPVGLGLNTTYGREEREALLVALGTRRDTAAQWYGAAGYVSLTPPGEVRLAVRQEWFVDQDGARTAFGSRLTVFSTTITLGHRIGKHLFARLEYRRDTADGGFFSDASNPGATRRTRDTLLFSLCSASF